MPRFTSVQEYMEAVPAQLRDVAEKAAAVVAAALPGLDAALWHGQPTWSRGGAPGRDPLCFVKAYPNHVTLGLWRGQDVDDPSGRLEPNSRRMASVKLRTLDDIDPDLFAGWLARAAKL